MPIERASSQSGLRTMSSTNANSRRMSLPSNVRIQEGQLLTQEILDLKTRLAAAMAQIDAEKHDNRVLSELVTDLHFENEELRGRSVSSNTSVVSLDLEPLSWNPPPERSHKSPPATGRPLSSKSLSSSSLLSLASRSLSELMKDLANEEVPTENRKLPTGTTGVANQAWGRRASKTIHDRTWQ